MCGLAAVFLKVNNFSDISRRLVRMTNIIKHRGPDDEGYLIVDNNNKFYCFGGNDTKLYGSGNDINYLPQSNINEKHFDKKIKIGLGFRRLSILDLTPSGHQPMSYAHSRYWIVFNGEIYNYLEIRNDLKNKNYNFQSNTDTEVIMAAYDYWGVGCLNKFNGMWAFILIDLQKQEVFIARDRFGIKPLYYYKDNTKVLFASEIKQFLAFGGLEIEPDIEKIKNDLIVDTREYTHETAFKNVYRFPNANFLKFNINNIFESDFKFNKYYNLSFLNENNYDNFSDMLARKYSEEYYSLLEDSVSLRLRSDVEVGTCFSGGLDSSSVVYIINKLLKGKNSIEKQKTFSLVFNSPQTKYCDESLFIDKLSEKLNLNSFKIEPSLQDIIENYENMIFAMDTPQHSTLMSYLLTYKLAKSHGVTVTLDGQGADELQAGYTPYFRYYFANTTLGNMPSQIKKNYNLMEGSKNEIKTGIIFSVFNSLGLKNFVEKQLSKRNLQTPYKNVNEKLFEDFNENLITLFHYGDRGAMINSVESRFPMMDYRLVEFWMNLPFTYKIHNGYTKYIARLAMNKKLPDEIVWRRDKKGWEMPQKEWIKDGLGDIILSKVRKSDFLKELELSVNELYLNKNFSDHKYWKYPIKLYNLALWHEIFFERFNERI
ncbi:MAG: asparagine synthase (glutamine-hydrolyzing) [Melioribacter sp.]|uniref:asparagine synthase (glutamine-hydrolyzing) n=1 Tax=Melioribacter sp. TaxID=2052167 RepID=UPI003BBDB564